MKKIIFLLLCIGIAYNVCLAQVYLKKQSRHRFAQLNMGIDFETNFGGTTKYLSGSGALNTLELKRTFKPRFVIGGTHFWGHADMYIAIPLLYPKMEEGNQEIQYLRGVETVFKLYPWKIEHNKFRPYLGVSVAPFYFEQSNQNLEFGNGPERNHTNFPILGGITFNKKNQLFELGIAWNYSNKQEYYISRTIQEVIETPPLYFNLSYRRMMETTISAEKSWESGYTKEITEKLASENKLNGWYFGAGLSSAFWLNKSSYNTIERPYVDNYGISIMPDFNLGYYLHQPDVNITLAYRGYGTSTNTYGSIQDLKRKSVAFEITKYLFDYHGFVPFMGPVISYESLSFKESFERAQTFDINEPQIGYGLSFGWDIRPNRIQSWILRTNLRWFPNLKLEVESGKEISFNNLEFNFIQLIIYPNRMIKRKK